MGRNFSLGTCRGLFYFKDKYHFIFIITILRGGTPPPQNYSSSGFLCIIFSTFYAQTDIHFKLGHSGPKAPVMGPSSLKMGTLAFRGG